MIAGNGFATLAACAFFALAAVLPVQPAAAVDLHAPGSNQATDEIQAAVLAFRDANRRWPASMTEVRSFARKKRLRLNLKDFESVKLVPHQADTIRILYVRKGAEGPPGEVALTVIEIR